MKQHVRDAGVAGSNPAAPTIDFNHFIIPSFGSRNEMRNELMDPVLGLRGPRAIWNWASRRLCRS